MEIVCACMALGSSLIALKNHQKAKHKLEDEENPPEDLIETFAPRGEQNILSQNIKPLDNENYNNRPFAQDLYYNNTAGRQMIPIPTDDSRRSVQDVLRNYYINNERKDTRPVYSSDTGITIKKQSEQNESRWAGRSGSMKSIQMLAERQNVKVLGNAVRRRQARLYDGVVPSGKFNSDIPVGMFAVTQRQRRNYKDPTIGQFREYRPAPGTQRGLSLDQPMGLGMLDPDPVSREKTWTMRNAARRSRGGTNGIAIPYQDLREKKDTSGREYEPLAQRLIVGIRKPRNNNATRRSEMYAAIETTSKQSEYTRMSNFQPPRKSQNPITASYITTRRDDFPVTIPHGTFRRSGGGSRGALNIYANDAVGKIIDGTRRDGVPGNVITPTVKQTDVSKQQRYGEDNHRDTSEYDIGHRTYDLASYLTARGNYVSFFIFHSIFQIQITILLIYFIYFIHFNFCFYFYSVLCQRLLKTIHATEVLVVSWTMRRRELVLINH
jgi:hypothetical protein